MEPAIQDIVAVLIVVAAAMFLVRRGWQALSHRRGMACGSCPDCPSVEKQSLVMISTDLNHAKALRREEQSA
jgi:hypothetical protein